MFFRLISIWQTSKDSFKYFSSIKIWETEKLLMPKYLTLPDFLRLSNAFDISFNGGLPFTPNGIGVTYTDGSDIIVTKFNYAGSNLLGSPYFGGVYNDGLNTSNQLKFNYADEIRGEIDIDEDGNMTTEL